MKIVTWNVNSVRARFDHVLSFLADEQPDVLALQEIKCEVGDLPVMEIRAAGYHVVALGQKSYNGVALVTRQAPEMVRDGLQGDPSREPEARAISARVGGVHFLNVYVPNGGDPQSDKYAHKLRWLDALKETIDSRYYDDDPLVVLGDFNIAPRDADVHDPRGWASSVLCTPAVRSRLQDLLAWGLTDVVPVDDPPYTWWDYRGAGYERDLGLRIDLTLVTSVISVRTSRVGRRWRGLERASDHAPVILEIDAP